MNFAIRRLCIGTGETVRATGCCSPRPDRSLPRGPVHTEAPAYCFPSSFSVPNRDACCGTRSGMSTAYLAPPSVVTGGARHITADTSWESKPGIRQRLITRHRATAGSALWRRIRDNRAVRP